MISDYFGSLLGRSGRGLLRLVRGPARVPRQRRVLSGEDMPQLAESPNLPLETLLSVPKAINER